MLSTKTKDYNKFKVKIVESLVSEGHIGEEGKFCNASSSASWKDFSYPNSLESCVQVDGLQTFPWVIQCTVPDGEVICGHISSTKGSHKTHLVCHVTALRGLHK